MLWRCGILGSVVLFLFTVANSTAAPFQNLDFEKANTNTLSYDPNSGVGSGPIQDLLPGWHVIVTLPAFNLGTYSFPGSTNLLKSLNFDSSFFDSPNIALNDYDPLDESVPRTGIYSLSISPGQGAITLTQQADLPIIRKPLNWSNPNKQSP